MHTVTTKATTKKYKTKQNKKQKNKTGTTAVMTPYEKKGEGMAQ